MSLASSLSAYSETSNPSGTRTPSESSAAAREAQSAPARAHATKDHRPPGNGARRPRSDVLSIMLRDSREEGEAGEAGRDNRLRQKNRATRSFRGDSGL